MFLRATFTSGLACLFAGCPSGRPVPPDSDECVDADGDGYGVGAACAGVDCDDDAPSLHDAADCDACDSQSTSAGCPCDATKPVQCYSGAPETDGVGACRPGVATCEGGFWSGCEGETVPADETCNEIDDDCDSEIDEDLEGECGGCGPCQELCWGGAGCAPWTDGVLDALAPDAAGSLALAGPPHVIWPFDLRRAAVHRVDTESLAFDGEIRVMPQTAFGEPTPYAVAVVASDSGDALVTSQIWDTRDAWLTRVADDPARCVDRDGDGEIATSRGEDSPLGFDSDEDFEDECILWHVRVGALGDGLGETVLLHRTVEDDGFFTDEVWVPSGYPHQVLRFDAPSGVALPDPIAIPRTVNWLGDVAMDADEWIWFGYRSTVVGFDPFDPDAEPVEIPLPEWSTNEIAIDENGTLWVDAYGLYRLNDAGASFDPIDIFAVGGLTSDGAGSMWASDVSVSREVYRVEGDGSALDTYTPATDVRTLAADFDGHVWGLGYGDATVYDVDDREEHPLFPECAATCLSSSALGDPTGHERRLFAPPTGSFSFVAEGCAGGPTRWTDLSTTVDVADGTRAGIAIRSADTPEALALAPWTGLGLLASDESVLPLGAAGEEHFLEVRMGFEAPDGTPSPTVEDLRIRWGCD